MKKSFPIPPGFLWQFERMGYFHEDGRRWDDKTNQFWDKDHNLLETTAELNTPREADVEETVEQEIQRKALTAPRVTPGDIDAAIIREEFQVFANSTLTICVLTLRNGFTVVGKSACASPANFDKALGERISRDDAKSQIGPLLGYALRERLYREQEG